MRAWLVVIALGSGCYRSHVRPAPNDAGPAHDGAVPPDAAMAIDAWTPADAGSDAGTPCPSFAAPVVDLFGAITFYAGGAPLPAGRYRVSYVDGCMKYNASQDWAINAYADGSIAWFLGARAGDRASILPGTAGIFADSGGFRDFDACVAANEGMSAELTHAGGPLGIWLADTNYRDNVSGPDGRTPSWRLDAICE